MDISMRAIFEQNTSATEAQLGRAEEIAERTGESLGAVLQMLGAISNEERLRCLAIRQGLEYISLAECPPAPELVRLVPLAELRRLRAIPVRVQLTLALANPLDAMSPDVIEQIQATIGYKVSVAVASEREIEAVLSSLEETPVVPEEEAPAIQPEPVTPPPAPEPEPEPEPVEPVEAVEPLEEETSVEAEPVDEVTPIEEQAPVEAEAVEDAPAVEAETFSLSLVDQRMLDAVREECPLSDEEVARALESSQTLGDDIGMGLVRTGAIAEADRVRAKGRVWGFEFFDLTDFTPDLSAVAAVSPEHLARCGAVPVRLDESTLWVAAADPLDLDAIDSLAVTTGRQVRAYIAVEADIRRILASIAPAHQ